MLKRFIRKTSPVAGIASLCRIDAHQLCAVMSFSRPASLATPQLHVKSALEASPDIMLRHFAALHGC